ncbi:MAG: sensor histidine kinase [Gemmatimonadales bacterium]
MQSDPLTLASLGFQTLITLLLALVNLGLWRRERRPYFLTWSAAWGVYALRLALISVFLLTGQLPWLFVHQLATGGTALLLLWASLQFSQGTTRRWQRRGIAAAAVLWVGVSLYGVQTFAVSGLVSAIALSAVTWWTALVFWRHRRQTRSQSATVLAVTFALWGLHHLDYPLLRPLGSGVLYGVFADVTLITVTATAILFLVLSEGKEALAARSAQLEQLTRLLLRAQEEERRRVARELHDEAGQILTAAKIELDLDGRTQAATLVERALLQVRNLSRLLRPAELDDLGLVPALRSLVQDFRQRAGIRADFHAPETLGPVRSDVEVALYRVVQEALTNVARHSHASNVEVWVRGEDDRVRVTIADNGTGAAGIPTPHLGLLGIQERLSELAGTVEITTAAGAGFRLDAVIPLSDARR